MTQVNNSPVNNATKWNECGLQLEMVNAIVEKYNLSFPQEILSRIDRNWLKLENTEEFEGLTPEQRCFAFLWLSNDKNRETGLADEIRDLVLEAMI